MPTAHDVYCFPTGTTNLDNTNTTVLDNVDIVDVNNDGIIETGDTFNGEVISTIGFGGSSGTDCNGDPILMNGGMFITTDAGNTYFIHKGADIDLVIDTITVTPPTTNTSTSTNSGYFGFQDDDVSFCCFTSDTMIKTRQGEVAVQDLRVGDRVLTLDNGAQTIRWIGSRKLAAIGNLAPIKISAGALGNDRDLLVSPQHRMLLQGWQASMLFGESEVLAAAKSLINDHTIQRQEGGEVEYFHILFDAHEIVWANGAPSESFHPGAQGMDAFEAPLRAEIYQLFPELESNVDAYGPSARISLKQAEVSMLQRA